MKYTVISIDEDLDFGCEERADDAPVMAVVTLQDAEGNQKICKAPDVDLYERDINPGDEVIINERGEIRKPLSGDWNKRIVQKPINTERFVAFMMAAKAGKPVDWNCPFCGGEVGLLEQTDGKTIIGCRECDMRITLEG